jgi:hypothetical protein
LWSRSSPNFFLNLASASAASRGAKGCSFCDRPIRLDSHHLRGCRLASVLLGEVDSVRCPTLVIAAAAAAALVGRAPGTPRTCPNFSSGWARPSRSPSPGCSSRGASGRPGSSCCRHLLLLPQVPAMSRCQVPVNMAH